ncbi:MAG: type II toxin-antitoxin system HicB family antitoxin [Thermodesulfobacteriota bacterium]
MHRDFTVVIEQDEEGYYVGHVPGLHGCHTQGRSLDELMERMREVILLCLEVEASEMPPTRFVGVQQVRIDA